MDNRRASADDAVDEAQHTHDPEEQEQLDPNQPEQTQEQKVDPLRQNQPFIIYENENESNINANTGAATSIPAQTISKSGSQTKS